MVSKPNAFYFVIESESELGNKYNEWWHTQSYWK